MTMDFSVSDASLYLRFRKGATLSAMIPRIFVTGIWAYPRLREMSIASMRMNVRMMNFRFQFSTARRGMLVCFPLWLRFINWSRFISYLVG